MGDLANKHLKARGRTSDRCLSCGSTELQIFLNLGKTPLANELVDREEQGVEQDQFPLEVALCARCALVQLTFIVDRTRIFEDYPYLSSYSDTVQESARSLVNRLISSRSLGPDDFVIELASNDGYLLKHYLEAGISSLGIEPAKNIARIARRRGIPTRSVFFATEIGHALAEEGKSASVIHANNVLAHVDDLHGFVGGIKAILRKQGVAVVEAPYIVDLVQKMEFDTIYHEHIFYFGLRSVQNLLKQHQLMVSDVEHIDLHGGSLRYFITHEGVEASQRVHEMAVEEESAGAHELSFYMDFGKRVERLGQELRELLSGLRDAGASIAAYGASAKGTTLLHALNIPKDWLEFVADRSTLKQGRLTPGLHLPIVSPEELVARRPDYTLLLTWNFAEEILLQQREYREAGGQFIVPIPSLKIV